MARPAPALRSRVVSAQRRDQRRITERGERTRARVIDAAAAAIANEGFTVATTNHIAKCAGVSWGVLQYHFGDKAGLLSALVEHAFAVLREGFESLESEGETATDRVASVLDAAWALFQTPTSRASMEVLANIRFEGHRANSEGRRVDVMQHEVARLGREALERAIGHGPRAKRVQTLVWMSIRGWTLAAMQGTPFDFERERAALLELVTESLEMERKVDSTRD